MTAPTDTPSESAFVARWEAHEEQPGRYCPLCGSELGRSSFATNSVALVECPSCLDHGIGFWITVQAGDDAARLRACGRMVDPRRVRRLLEIRAQEGGPVIVQESDMDGLLSDS